LQFNRGQATFTCSTQASHQQSVEIYGTDALLEVEIPFNPPWNVPTHVYKHTGEGTETINFEPCNQFTIQAERFARAILEDKPVPTPLADAVQNMKVLDAVFESADKQKWMNLRDF
jgi:predicted dehydrogenase